MAISHFSPQFQISAWAEISHVMATKFQPGGRAETRHVIGPLVVPSPGDHKNVAGLASFDFRIL